MCDIDKELVMRGAAHFATYAAEREPPRPEPFTARLIERALRNHALKLAPPAPPGPTPSVVNPMSTRPPRRQAEVLDFLRRHTAGATLKEIADALKIKNGNVAYFAAALVSKGFAIVDAAGKYHVAPSAISPPKSAVTMKASPVSAAEVASRIDRIMALLRESPGQKFSPSELAEKCGLSSPSHSGATHGLLGRLIKQGMVAKVGKGLYALGKKGAAA